MSAPDDERAREEPQADSPETPASPSEPPEPTRSGEPQETVHSCEHPEPVQSGEPHESARLGEPSEPVDPYEPEERVGPGDSAVLTPGTRKLVSWTWVVVGAVALALLMRGLVLEAFFIPSESMTPVLEVGDRLLVEKVGYRFSQPDPGDVVVFRTPEGVSGADTRELVKRVIATGGQSVMADDGSVYVDGRRLAEDYLTPGTKTRDFGPVDVQSGHVFVMGDNRGLSRDSRDFGEVKVSLIVGRAFWRYWPPSRVGGI